MKLRSLRAQLSLWHAGLLAVTLVSLAGLTYVMLRQMLHSRADAALEDYAETTAKTIAATLYQSTVGQRQLPKFLSNDLQSWGRYIQVIDSRGNVREVSDALRSHPLPVSTTALVRGMKGLSTFETVTNLGEHPVRIVTVPVQMGSKVPYLVQAGASLEGVDATLQRASAILLVLTPSVLLVGLLGGWLLVGRALKPVDEMTRAALEIESSSLDRRIVPPRTDDEIGRLAAAFNEMIARLDRSFRQIQQFTADASHELKTPLTTMRGEAEVALMSDLTPEEYRKVLRSIIEEVERMSAIVENLLLLARADANAVQLKREAVALHDIVMTVYEQMEAIARRKGVSLELEEIDEATVEGDPLWLQQIVTNLLNNAIKYTPEGGKVSVTLKGEVKGEGRRRQAGENDDFPLLPLTSSHFPFVVLSVSDTGVGIPPEHLPHIFDRFYRVDAGRSRDAGGSGLGLNIVKWAVEAHGGTIAVESEVGKGTTFTVRLPQVPGPAEDAEDAKAQRRDVEVV
ncbi:MAG: ATP-binding protein [Abditibacteriales bacterium]|nr:ATP-binding protein [Abditibacteriales bacterium]MDW8366279.1 ATP-binding protein [Abditibacteriales bacterium]